MKCPIAIRQGRVFSLLNNRYKFKLMTAFLILMMYMVWLDAGSFQRLISSICRHTSHSFFKEAKGLPNVALSRTYMAQNSIKVKNTSKTSSWNKKLDHLLSKLVLTSPRFPTHLNKSRTRMDGRSNNSFLIKTSQFSERAQIPSTKLPPLFCNRTPITAVNCTALIKGNATELQRVRELMKNESRNSISGEGFVNLTKDCSLFISTRGYVTSPLTSVEREFPIAFSLLLYKDIEQAERLLRAIYRPQNVYCVHVDKKSSLDIREGMDAIANCFDNVFVIQNAIDVRWGEFTVLKAELVCMKALWAYKKWKYFINLTGEEFPLKTNFELVKILMAYNGANNVAGTVKRVNRGRWKYAGRPPHGYVMTKGSVHVTLSRRFVGFLLHNETALNLLKWVKRTYIPDETYFSTLNHNPQFGVPGSYKGIPEKDADTYPFLTRYKVWRSPFHSRCNGKLVRDVCIFGVGDLPALTSKLHLFANKFHWDFEHYALDCLEEWHYRRTRNQYLSNADFDVSYYKNLSFVKNHV